MVTAPLSATGLRIDLPNVQAANTPVKDAKLVVSVTKDERAVARRDRRHRQPRSGAQDQRARADRERALHPRRRASALRRGRARGRRGAISRRDSLNLLVNPEEEKRSARSGVDRHAELLVARDRARRGRSRSSRRSEVCRSSGAAEARRYAPTSPTSGPAHVGRHHAHRRRRSAPQARLQEPAGQAARSLDRASRRWSASAAQALPLTARAGHARSDPRPRACPTPDRSRRRPKRDLAKQVDVPVASGPKQVPRRCPRWKAPPTASKKEPKPIR